MSTKKIYVAGHKGMVGSAICRQLSKNRDIELISQNAIATIKKNNSLEKIADLEFTLYIND